MVNRSWPRLLNSTAAPPRAPTQDVYKIVQPYWAGWQNLLRWLICNAHNSLRGTPSFSGNQSSQQA